MKEREIAAWVVAASMAVLLLVLYAISGSTEDARDAALQQSRLAKDREYIMRLKLEACEEMYAKREKQADTCWATLAEVLP